MDTDSPIVVALDGMTYRRAMFLARKLQGHVWGFKVGDLIDRRGISVVEDLKQYGRVWADVKLYDIGNTVRNRLLPYVEIGTDLVTVAVDAGEASLRSAVEVRGNTKILAVTVLTTTSSDDIRNFEGVLEHPRRDLVGERIIKLAGLAVRCGVDGMVCAPADLQYLQALDLTDDFLIAATSIRSLNTKVSNDDQNLDRSGTPAQAVSNGADLIVIGRPIYTSKNPLRVVEKITEELKSST